MKLGVMAALFAGMKLDDALVYCAELGLEAIELPVEFMTNWSIMQPEGDQ